MRRSFFAALAAASILSIAPVTLKINRYNQLSRFDRSREIRLIDFLKADDFEASISYLRDNTFTIRASRDACVMDLREVAPSGYDRAAMKAMAADRRLFYVDSGIVSREQPAWRTWAYFHLRRFASFVGWPIERRLTFAVTQDLSCGNIDWSKLSIVVFDAGRATAIRLRTSSVIVGRSAATGHAPAKQAGSQA